MIRIIDTISQIDSLFGNGTFNNEKWEIYMNTIYDKSADIFKNDLNERIVDCFEHELGHAYHKQYCVFEQQSDDNCKSFVWQLFTEGIAMYFDQVLVGDLNYYHQNKDGWLDWCNQSFQQIVADFHNDLPTMTRFNQRYFGDWVEYCGKGDVGYFLGTKFVQHLLDKCSFEQLIRVGIDEIYQEFFVFSEEI